MVQFKRYDGTVAELDPFWMSPDTHISVISESDSHVLIRSSQGLVASIAKGVFRSNHIDPPSSEMDLDPSLYRHYFKDPTHNRKGDLDERLLKSLKDILSNLNHQQLVINTPQYYLIRPEWLRSGLAYGGSCQATLGAMLQAWNASDDLCIRDMKAQKLTYLYPKQKQPEALSSDGAITNDLRCVPELMIMHVNGSPLSGSHSTRAWCRETKEVYVINTSQGGSGLPNGVASTFKKLHDIASTTELVLEKELLAMERLLADVGALGKGV
jgi:hypothetical protein